MGKSKSRKKLESLIDQKSENAIPGTSVKTSILLSDSRLRYKLSVLIYDLRNIMKDHNSEVRTLSTTDELYLSLPYFTNAESAAIKTALVDRTDVGELDGIKLEQNQTSEMAIKTNLATFFEKRKASEDSRPCGPHDIAPLYQKVFGIETAEIQDDRFLARLRRQGLKQ
jgi:hypothetical protein